MNIVFIAPRYNDAASRAVREYKIALAKVGIDTAHVLLQCDNMFFNNNNKEFKTNLSKILRD